MVLRMRLDTVFKFKFTYEYWILGQNSSGQTVYVKKDDRTGMLLPGGQAGGAMISKDAMDVPMQIRNVRDASGNLVYQVGGVGFPMYVTTAEPQLDPFSNVIAYRHQLRRELPREYSEFISEVLQQG